jgi:CubicO group peptidase (beta-lactamase class C family)
MKKFYPFLLLFTVLISCSKESKDDRITNITRFMDGQAKHYKFNGSVLVAEKGNVVYKATFGLADFDRNKPLNDSTIFELASVSKQFTAMAIMLLREGNKLKLTDSLRAHFPELPYSGVTIYQMLTHTSGLPDYESTMNGKWDETKIAFNRDVINFFATEKPPMHFKPGTKWEYSNTGFVLLASIVEKVSGEPFNTYMTKHIFQPLNMKNTRIFNTRRSGEVIENYAYGYVWSDSLKTFLLPDSIPEMKFVYWLDGMQGDGVVNSTAEDLLKWDHAITNNQLVPASVIKEMTAQHALMDTARHYYYGYGMIVGKNEFGKFVTHSGGWPGYVTNLARYTEGDRTIIVLSNNGSASPPITTSIAHILFNDSVKIPYSHTPIVLDSIASNAFVGRYEIKSEKMKIVREKEKLFAVYPSGKRFALKPESPHIVFDNEGFDVQYEIEKGKDGENKYYRILYGIKEEMMRVD